MARDKEFTEAERKYYLEDYGEERCDVCDSLRTIYASKYSQNIFGFYCPTCHDWRVSCELKDDEANVCPECGELVEFEDSDRENFVICYQEECEQKAHLVCVADKVCVDCGLWICAKDESSTDLIQCDHCGKYHNLDCIVSMQKEFVKEYGYICSPCFHRDRELQKTLSQRFCSEHQKNVLDSIAKNSRFYMTEARENPDLTVMLTHLVKGEDPYGSLKNILTDKCIRAKPTGYFGKSEGTQAVCLADLTIRGLYRHSKRYSPFGIAFLKEHVFALGGGPALYVREDVLKEHGVHIPTDIKAYVNKIEIDKWDFHHEREWRVPCDLVFDLEEICIVYAPHSYHKELREMFPEVTMFMDIDVLLIV